MEDVFVTVKKLLELSTSSNENEANVAARRACMLIREHKLINNKADAMHDVLIALGALSGFILTVVSSKGLPKGLSEKDLLEAVHVFKDAANRLKP